MSKTIEEIKNEYANEISPHRWFVMTMRKARITDEQVNEVLNATPKSKHRNLLSRIQSLLECFLNVKCFAKL